MTAEPGQNHPETSVQPPYQLLPSLSDDEYAALRDDIAVRGVLVPVEVTEDGEVLDGHHRLRACGELGITTYPRVIRSGLSEAERRQHALVLNLHRRHLTAAVRRQMVAALRAQGYSSRRIASSTGLSQSTVVRDLRAARGESPDSPADAVVGTDGKRYPARTRRPAGRTSVYAQTNGEQRRAEAALDVLGDDAPGRPLDLKRAERLARDKRAVDRRTAARTPVEGLPPSVDIRHTPMTDLDIDPGTVDLILTDPPYTRTAVLDDRAYDILGERAATWLKPGGLLVAYCGQMYLPQAMAGLARSLEYWWMLALLGRPGTGVTQIRPRGLGSAWKPLLVYRQPGGQDLPPWTLDVVHGHGRSKTTAHPWEQGVPEAQHLIERLTQPGDLIVDPFVGSGTVAVAAATTGRRVIAADIDGGHVAVARERVAEVIPGHPGETRN